MDNKIRIESIVDVNNFNILWADLGPEYRGYQMANIGIVRSLKMFNKYNYGYLINHDKDNNYVLSNSVNQRIKISFAELLDIANKNGFCFPTFTNNVYSRNPRCTSQSEYKKKAVQRKQNNEKNKQEIVFPKFTIIDK